MLRAVLFYQIELNLYIPTRETELVLHMKLKQPTSLNLALLAISPQGPV